MKFYKVYAKVIQNNSVSESTYIQSICAKNKKHACFIVSNMVDNRSIYHLNSYFAIAEYNK